MNILFLLKHYEIGGVEVVTQILANKFVVDGHNVTIVCFQKPAPIILEWLNKKVEVLILSKPIYSKLNRIKLRAYIKDNNIGIIINQWGLPFHPAKLAYEAKKGMSTKIISVQHNTPNVNERTTSVNYKLQNTPQGVRRTVLKVKLKVFATITGLSMRYVYNKSDKFLLLSKSFVPNFEHFTHLKKARKLGVITNPVTIDSSDYIYAPTNKRKEIIYVGRMDFNQKRVDRVINVWGEIFEKFPDWQLTLIGDGPYKNVLETLVNNSGIKNIVFAGFQPPGQYYKQAQILLLTSEYEGFPLVIPEAMSFGVVPVVYGSYSAVYDIIDNNINGYIIPQKDSTFDADSMISQIENLILDKGKRFKLAQNAIEKSKSFSIEEISQKWYNLFTQIH